MNKYFILFYIANILFINVESISTGANEPIADNQLGLTAKDCALQYCSSKDGMVLWLTLMNVCVSDPNPYFIEKNKDNEVIVISKMIDYDYSLSNSMNFHIDKFVGASLIATCSLMSFFIGYITSWR